MRSVLLFISLLCTASSYCQNVEFGFGSSYDFGIDLPNTGRYAAYRDGRTSFFSLDAFIGIPVGRFMLRPTFIYSIPTNSLYLQNLQGKEVPLGYNISVPYLDEGEGWTPTIYSDDYTYREADAEIWQQSYGSYIMYVLTEGVEIGAGIFYRKKTLEVTNYTAYDEYSWYASTDTVLDHYIHEQTWIEPQALEKVHFRSLSFPLTLNFKYETDGIYNGFSFSYWVPGDSYFTFRYTFGITFGNQ